MGRIEKTVFISYRRTNLPWALCIYQNLTMHGYDVFFDYQSIDSGNFEKVILENIKSRAHFLVILTPSALERCKEPNDWLRREIETAIDEKRNIIPLMLDSFDFGSPLVTEVLIGKLSSLKTYNGLRVYSEYFFEAMNKLRDRYLNTALDDIYLPSLNIEAKKITEIQQSAASDAPQVEKEELTAQEWLERGYTFAVETKNMNEAFRCFSEAVRLNPNHTIAQYNLGRSLTELKRFNEAEVAYRKTIEINPSHASAYNNLGSVLLLLKHYDEAEVVFQKAIELKPNEALYYSNLGSLFNDLKRYTEAEAAYLKAIKLYEVSPSGGNPDEANAYSNLGIVLKNLKRYDEAEATHRKAIELYEVSPSGDNPDYATTYSNLGVLLTDLKRYNEAEPVYHKAIELKPDDTTTYYNLACLKSLTGNLESAFEYLEKSSRLEGFDPAWTWKDPDLQWIRDDPRFVQIVGPKPE